MNEHTSNMIFSSGVSTTSSNDRLPDAVQQAKERLHERLRRADLSLVRSCCRQTARASGTIATGPIPPPGVATCTYEDGQFDCQSILFSSNPADDFHGVGKDTTTPVVLVEPFPDNASKLEKEISGGRRELSDEEYSVECPICLEGCHNSGGLIQLRCKHIFHSACLEQWLQTRGDCPYCRVSVETPS